MPYSDYLKRRAIALRQKRLSAPAISDALAKEGLEATRQGIDKFLKRYDMTHSLARARGSGRPSKVTPAVEAIVEAQMRADDKTTVAQLRKILHEKGHDLSLSTVSRTRAFHGMTFRGSPRSAHRQIIRDANKTRRLEWALQYEAEAEAEAGFCDVVYTDETSILLEPHPPFCICCRKLGEPTKNEPRYAAVYVILDM